MTQTYLGFDFGKKHIGVAVGQTITATARPLTSLKAIDGVPDWNEVEKLIQQWQPEALVVGIPINMDDTEYWLTDAAREFAEKLTEKTKLNVHQIDERLSTVEAREQLFEQGGFKALKKSAIDSLSAKLILETWLRGG